MWDVITQQGSLLSRNDRAQQNTKLSDRLLGNESMENTTSNNYSMELQSWYIAAICLGLGLLLILIVICVCKAGEIARCLRRCCECRRRRRERVNPETPKLQRTDSYRPQVSPASASRSVSVSVSQKAFHKHDKSTERELMTHTQEPTPAPAPVRSSSQFQSQSQSQPQSQPGKSQPKRCPDSRSSKANTQSGEHVSQKAQKLPPIPSREHKSSANLINNSKATHESKPEGGEYKAHTHQIGSNVAKVPGPKRRGSKMAEGYSKEQPLNALGIVHKTTSPLPRRVLPSQPQPESNTLHKGEG